MKWLLNKWRELGETFQDEDYDYLLFCVLTILFLYFLVAILLVILESLAVMKLSIAERVIFGFWTNIWRP